VRQRIGSDACCVVVIRIAGGFSSVDPWLPMGNFSERNVNQQRSNRFSLLSLYHRLISLRRREPALQLGAYQPLRNANDIVTYERVLAETRIVVAFNTVDQPRLWEWSGKGTLLISSYLDRDEMPLKCSILLRKSEGVIIRRD
jgi:alpha-glucosidase